MSIKHHLPTTLNNVNLRSRMRKENTNNLSVTVVYEYKKKKRVSEIVNLYFIIILKYVEYSNNDGYYLF